VATYRVEARAAAGRALLAVAGVLVALVVIGPGSLAAAVERPGPPAAAASSDSEDAAPSMEAPRSAVLVRTTGLAVLPAPTGPAGGLLPGPGPDVAPHLLAEPQTRPPTLPLERSAVSGTSSRAPPGPAGT